MMYRVFGFLFSRGLWNFLGIVALSLLVWIAGPLVAIGAVRPLEPERHRILVIVALFAFWLLRLLWRKWREGRLNAQLLGQLRRPSAELAAEPEPGNPEIRELESRFDEAVALLRKTRFDGKSGRWSLDRYSRQYLYQLPWYVIIGAPGSGKTTALVNSGLNFPLADRFGKTALRGVGGTRNCDWWFTDDAVLLDTAGRYTTHESDPTGDEEEWTGFLGLLSRFRGRQPINGAMLTVSVEDLLSASDAERAQHAAVLRKRLQELREQLGIRFPVYVLVTKVDLLSGFEEYFASFGREDLEQVWGFTLPYARSQEPAFDLYEAFHTEYRLLQRRLDDALPEVLAAEPDPASRARAYLLPQQFAGLQGVLGHFLSDVFATSRYEARLVPRGVYFTSGTQGGETFDQVTGHLRRYLRIDGAGAPAPVPADGEGRSFFLKNLLQEVIFREAGLAGRNLRWERRYRRLHWAGYGLITAVFLALVAGWAVSYGNNRGYLDEVARRVPTMEALGREIKITRAGDVLGLMPFLDGMWYLPRHEGFELDSPPWRYRFGLYQGHKMQAAAQGVYGGTLGDVLLPQVARRVETALRQARPGDLEYGYEALRAYLMLYETERYDAEFMHAWLLSDMSRTLPEGYTRHQYDMLSLHLRNLVQGRVLASPFPRDDELVRAAREQLARYTLPQRAYSRLRRLLAGTDQEAADTTAVTLGGPQASSVFMRKSGKPLSDGIPALFTYRGYWEVFNPRITRVAERLRSDDGWILDIAPPGLLAQDANQQLITDVRRLYLNDYVAQWDAYLNDLTLAPRKSLLQSIQMARTLSAPDSPLVRLVQSVARETTLLRDAAEGERSLAQQARDGVSSTREALEQMFGRVGPAGLQRSDADAEKPEGIVDQHFEPWRRLAASEGNGQPPPIAATAGLIDELYTYLTAADAALRSGSQAPGSDVVTKLRAEAGRLPAPLREALDNLSTGAAGEISGVARERLGDTVYATIGLFCRQSIAGRYPFSPGSERDVAPNDMARLFAPGGMMDMFFQQNLVSQIDVSGSRWRFKPGIDGAPADASGFLQSFQRAAVIRDVYFMAGSNMPSYNVSIRPVEMDPEITQFVMDVDGQAVRYAHGPQVAANVQWPGPRGTNQVRIELTPQVGTAGLVSSGPWALNRMLDKAALQRGRSSEVTLATFNVGGRKVVLEITASSVKSPFRLAEMQGFSCPGRS